MCCWQTVLRANTSRVKGSHVCHLPPGWKQLGSKHRYDFEKPLHDFKQITCKYEIHVQKASLQPAASQSVIKPFKKGAWLDFKRALVTRWKSTCCKSIRHLLEARRACVALNCMKTVYKHRWYGNNLSVEDGKTCWCTGIISIRLFSILSCSLSSFVWHFQLLHTGRTICARM